MNSSESRRDELIAAAVAGDLDDTDRADLDRLAADDPTVAEEIRSLRAVADRMTGVRWTEPEPSDVLRRRVLGVSRRAPGRVAVAAAAAVGIVVGIGVAVGAQGWSDREVTGPPGTLGAFEQIDFVESLTGVRIDGGLVAHTWGTETVLEMDGVPVNETFEVFLVERSGADAPSGTFRGSAVTIDCRLNAAVLRPDVVGIEIRRDTGETVAEAAVPGVV